MAGPDFAVALADLDKALSSIEAVVDPDRKRAEIADLEQQVAAPDLWDNPDRAQRVTSRLSALQTEVDRVGLQAQLDDLGALVQLGQEEEIKPASPRQQTCSPRCRRRSKSLRYARCYPVSTTSARRLSQSALKPAASTLPTSPPCCYGCTSDGPNAIASQPRYMTPPTRRKRASSPPHSR